MYHSSWRTSSSCLRVVGEGNLLLILCSKTDHSGLMIFKAGYCAGRGRCWSASSCSSNQDCTLLAVHMDELSSWKIASLLGNSIWFIWCTQLPKMSTSLTVIWPFRVIIGPAEYQQIAAQIITDKPPCFTIGIRHSPNIHLDWCWEQCEGQLIWPYYIFPVIRCPGFTIITPSFFTFWHCFQ